MLSSFLLSRGVGEKGFSDRRAAASIHTRDGASAIPTWRGMSDRNRAHSVASVREPKAGGGIPNPRRAVSCTLCDRSDLEPRPPRVVHMHIQWLLSFTDGVVATSAVASH